MPSQKSSGFTVSKKTSEAVGILAPNCSKKKSSEVDENNGEKWGVYRSPDLASSLFTTVVTVRFIGFMDSSNEIQGKKNRPPIFYPTKTVKTDVDVFICRPM